MIKKISIILAVAVLLPLTGVAASIQVGEEYTLPKAEKVFDNLYIGSGNAVVAGDISGDLVIAGGSILVTGNVAEDILAAGGTINLLGAVADDIRIAGGQITIGSTVGGDALIGGGQVQIVSGSRINGDLIITGGRVVVDGEVKGAIKIFGGEVDLNNALASSVEVSAGQLRLGEGATIAGDVYYRGEKEAIMAEGAVIRGKYTFEQIDFGRKGMATRSLFEGFRAMRFGLTLVTALILFWLAREKMQLLVNRIFGNFPRELLRGVITGITLPIVSVIAMLTLVGIPLGIMGLLVYTLIAMLSCLMSGVVLGVWIKKVILRKGDELSWISVAGGVVAITLLGLIPVIGWLVSMIIVLATSGAMYYGVYRLLRRGQ